MPRTNDFHPLQSRIETLWGQVTLIVVVIESSFSFYIYALCGGKFFRETLLERIIRCLNNRLE
jgi:hypothetical protein